MGALSRKLDVLSGKTERPSAIRSVACVSQGRVVSLTSIFSRTYNAYRIPVRTPGTIRAWHQPVLHTGAGDRIFALRAKGCVDVVPETRGGTARRKESLIHECQSVVDGLPTGRSCTDSC